MIRYTILLLCAVFLLQQHTSSAFTVQTQQVQHSSFLSFYTTQTQPSIESTTSLFAAKKKTKDKRATRNKIGKRVSSTSGFGGAAVEACPCGSGLGYMKCCGKIHKNADEFAAATPEQIVRARYSAYAKREVDFIIGSTHPLNEKNFMADIEHWRETIRTNCYDNFELTSCQILSESIEGEGDKAVGTVKFIASMTQVDSREKTSFMETSTFERAGKHIRQGAWLYKDGVVEPVEVEYEEGDEDADADAEEVNSKEAESK